MHARVLTRRYSAAALFVILGLGASMGLECPDDGGPPDPNVNPGNRAPRVQITSVTTPNGDGTVEQGDLVTIDFTGSDSEDRANVRIFASTKDNPTPDEEISILENFPIGPGEGDGRAFWRTNTVPPASYFIFAEISDGTLNAADNTGNPPVRVVFVDPVLVVPEGIGEDNGSPAITINLPATDAGLSNEDILTVRYAVSDPDSDEDTLIVRVLFDLDRSPANDATEPPLEVASETLPPGVVPVGGELVVSEDVTIDLNLLPIRLEVDEGRRPLPYFVRVQADDGQGHVVDEYAVGAVRLLRAPVDVVDLINIGGSVSGATWQGFDGDPVNPTSGSRAGSAFASLGDFDSDGLDDFAVVAETASPFNNFRVGETYVIYGRERRIDPDLAQLLPFGTGRYAGVINLNTVGSFIPFPSNDPRFRTLFNIRGHIMPAPMSLTGTTMGITAVTPYDDQTGDGRPEVLIGHPLNHSMDDSEDDDPCDVCTFDEEFAAQFTCFNEAPRFFPNDMNSEVDFDADPGAGNWLPFDPAAPIPFFPPNANFELEADRIVNLDSFLMVVTGQTADESEDPFTILVKLENDEGPELEIDVTNFTDQDGTFTATGFFPLDDPSLPVALGEPVPPSVYDGIFTVFVQSSKQLQDFEMTARANGSTITPVTEPIAARARYPDEFPNPFSTETGGDAGIDPQGINDLSVACPPGNRSITPLELDGYGNRDGHSCDEVQNLIVGCDGFDDDGLSGFGNELGELSGALFMVGSDDIVLPVFTGVDANDDGIPDDGPSGTWTGAGQRRPELVQAGQPDLASPNSGTPYRGARIRGAWSNPFGQYDPLSLHSYTVDTIPDMDTVHSAEAEVLVSAPAGGIFGAPGSANLVTDLGGLFSNDGSIPGAVTSATATFNLGARFSNTEFASVFLAGEAVSAPVLRFGLDNGAGGFIDGTVREVLLWAGAEPAGDDDQAPTLPPGSIIGNTIQFAQTFDFPSTAAQFLTEGTGVLRIEIRDDCAVEFSSFRLDAVEIAVGGLVRDVGYVRIYQGDDYSDCDFIEPRHCPTLLQFEHADDQTGLDAPASWPSFFGRCPPAGFDRFLCDIDTVADILGEGIGDNLGFAHHGGDLNLDGVVDVACGAPGSDNDPINRDLFCGVEQNPLTNNGKVYFIYGTPTLGNGRPCDLPERFEIRGTHADDQFGRVQGNAGDIDGDSNDDVFFAAEGYDALGEDFDNNGSPDVGTFGTNVGFVGVLFGRTYGNGTRAIRCEQVGTANFPGVKFVGGSQGARLSGGTTGNGVAGTFSPGERGQYGVSSAGDYNSDGFEDLLLSAPGQPWPAAKIEFEGDVADGEVVAINGLQFEFDTNGSITAGSIAVPITDNEALTAQRALIDKLATQNPETLGASSLQAQNQFPAPLPDTPTINFLRRTFTSLSGWVSARGPGGGATNVQVTQTTRLGVSYLVYGDVTLLTNKTFVLPQDLNRRNNQGKRVLKGMVFVSGFEKNTGANDPTPDEGPVEVVSRIGDIDGDGFVDIMLGAPQADFINIIAPDERRQASGEAYLIYGNSFGLNASTAP